MTTAKPIRMKPRPASRKAFVLNRVVLGLPQTAFTNAVAEELHFRGLTVEFARSPESARRKAIGHAGTAVVVPVAHEAEGGLLTTAKIVTAVPESKVILLAASADERLSSFAEFIDATIAFETDGPDALVDAILK